MTINRRQPPTWHDVVLDTIKTAGPDIPTTERRDAYLVHIYPSGPLLGSRYSLGACPTLIGRSEDCQVRNPDASVSRHHARVEPGADGRFYVTDLGSTNGTFVNNEAGPTRALQDGDYLRVGDCIYRFLAGGNLEAAYHEEIHRLTVLDPLTGVPNRRFMSEFLDRELARAVRYGRPVALALFDIDRFKSINDGMGHLAGDLTLRELCRCVQPMVRQDELFARYGGEEFALVLPEAGPVEAGRAGERFRKAIEGHAFTFEGKRFPVTVSIGIGVTDGIESVTATDLIARADAKLYEAKQTGRNRVVV